MRKSLSALATPMVMALQREHSSRLQIYTALHIVSRLTPVMNWSYQLAHYELFPAANNYHVSGNARQGSHLRKGNMCEYRKALLQAHNRYFDRLQQALMGANGCHVFSLLHLMLCRPCMSLSSRLRVLTSAISYTHSMPTDT